MIYDNIVIVSAARTAFGRFGGSLKDYDYYDLGAIPMREVINRVKIDPSAVDEVYWGVGDTSVCKDVFTPVAARQTLLKAGMPPTTPSVAIDKACVSAMSAVHYGCRAMQAGEISSAIGGGATLFSQEPLIGRGLRLSGFRIGNVQLEDPLFEMRYKDFSSVAVDAGQTAVELDITREEQDEWAMRSHLLYKEAFTNNKFEEEIIPLSIPQRKGDAIFFNQDEQFRSNIKLESLERLKTIYGSPTVTAGNAPGLNDGAAAVLFMTQKRADELGLEPLGQILSMSSIAIEPHRLAEAPAFAIWDVLKKADISLTDIDVLEINEAFAAVPLASTKLLAENDRNLWEAIKDKTNINGSAIAIGHPNTASGARIIMNLLYELRRRGGGMAIGAICGGLAQGDAILLKV
jgi:acetyl-CoA C-acetyltransferase